MYECMYVVYVKHLRSIADYIGNVWFLKGFFSSESVHHQLNNGLLTSIFS